MDLARRAIACVVLVVASSVALVAPVGSASTRDTRRDDVVYRIVDGERLTLDLHVPATSGETDTLIVYIHGGGWVGGDKAETENAAQQLASAGYAVATMNYRLADEHQFPAAVDDVTAALDYLTQHGDELAPGLTTSRLVLLGSSAGGELAALVGATDERVAAVIGWSGVYDLSLLGDETLSYLGCTAFQCPDIVSAASPIDWVDSDDPPVLLVHATNDPIVPAEQATRYAAQLAANGVEHQLDLVDGSAHAEQLGGTAVQATVGFLEQLGDSS